MNLLLTGGCGFIGSNFIRYILKNYLAYRIINLDALTYAGNPDNLKEFEKSPRYQFICGRIEDPETVKKAMKGVDAVIHFAAESHVDRSILNAAPFIITNVVGTQVLLDAALNYGIRRFVHISTDEVYGALGEDGLFTEQTPLAPRSPYAASKAAADLLVQAYYKTHKLPVIIVRPSNNYGPYQYPEKLIPLAITNIIEGKKVPVYAKGQNVRDWLYVEDNCYAIFKVLLDGRDGEIYNIGGLCEKRNIDVVKTILKVMDRPEDWIEFVPDRPGHDFRYALDNSKIEKELGWRPSVSFEEGIKKTVRWYQENQNWWQPLKAKLKKESNGFWTERNQI